MEVWTLISITLFQFLNCTMADWDLDSPLILVDLPGHGKIFPIAVRVSSRYRCIVYVKSGDNVSITYPFCPKPDDRDEYCNYAESFVTSKYATEQLPATCPLPVQFYLMKFTIQNEFGSRQHQSCTHNGKAGYRYKFVYWLCKENSPRDKKGILIYDACYQETEHQIILGSYKIHTPDLLRNEYLTDEQSFQFDFVNEPFYPELNHCQTLAPFLYHQNPEYIQRSVLPHEFLAFGHQRRPFHHCLNLAPMNKDLLAGWEELMMKLKAKISWMRGVINITAGLINEEVQENKRYLGYIEHGVGEIEIPVIWWILIYNRDNSKGVAILMHNELYYTNQGIPLHYYDNQRCSTSLCFVANLSDAVPGTYSYPHNFIYCCQPHVINENFGLSGSNDILVFP